MHDSSEHFRAAIRVGRTGWGRPSKVRVRALAFSAVFVALAGLAGGAIAQNTLPPAMDAAGTDPGAPPVAQSGGGDVNFFSQDLGTILRLRYNTNSYGQDGVGNFDVGTMQVVTMDDTAAFFDGQVTMNDVDGVGFNVGLGYRWLDFPPYAADTGRMEGISLWADGTHTDAGNFFPQIGVSLESLGELWDIRANGYIPVGQKEQVGAFKPTNQIGFNANSIAALTQATVDRSFYSGELEIARRLGVNRDAWGFAGPYFVANDTDDSAGFRAGLRGYAYPDLLLQFAVSHDDVFNTNATFSVVWFVGRTRTNFQPACGTPDRFREPVMRNDYVVLSHTTRQGGTPLTNPDGTALRVVHVASDAAPGGDGTFEHPFDMLTDANGTGSQKGDIIFVHSTSVFNNEASLVLKDNQKLLGEGNNLMLMVDTEQKGTILIPESSPGARAKTQPTINIPANTDAVTLANTNEVANFIMDGQNNAGNRAIAAPASGAGNPNLHDLIIKNTGSDAIFFKPENFVDSTSGNTVVPGNVTVNNVTLSNIGGEGINIDSDTSVDVTQPNVTLQEVIALSNIKSTNGAGHGINIENTHTGAANTVTLTNYTYDGGTTSAGGVRLNNFNSTFTASSSTLTNGATTGSGIQILGNTGGTITFANTVTLNSLDGTAVDINGDVGGVDKLTGNISINGAITNDTGRSISVQNVAAGANINFIGNLTDSGQGVLANSNSGGLILFGGDMMMTTTTNNAITLTDNTGAEIDFPGKLDITTTSGNGFVATGGGTLSVAGTTNTITTQTGQDLKITGMTIATTGANFGDVNRTASAGTNAIQLENNTGGPITVGNTTDMAGDAGTITGGTVDAVHITNSANVTITGLRINNSSAVSGVRVENSGTTASTVNLNNLEINNGDIGVETVGGGTGALTMTVNDSNINRSTAQGMLFNNVDAGTVHVNNANIDGNNVNGTAGGVKITGSNASISFDNATTIHEFGGTDFEVDGGAGTISYGGSIVNSSTTNPADTSGHSVVVHNVTGGTVNFTANSTIDDTNQGMQVTNNTGGTFNFLGTNTFNTGANDAVTITGNSAAATISLSDLTITTTSGRGLLATGAGTFSVLGPNNTITTTTGTGLDIEGMTIDPTGVLFQSVTVNGAANGIVLMNLGGTGDVTIGSSGGLQNSGGSLTTTGDAIVLQNTPSVTLNHVQIVSAGGQGVNIDQTAGATTNMDVTIDDLNLQASTGNGIDFLGANNAHTLNLKLNNSQIQSNVNGSITGSGAFGLLVDNNNISSGGDVAFALSFSGSAQTGNLTFRNGNSFTAGDASALSITGSGATAKTITLLVQDSSFANNSLSSTADFLSSGTTLMNATIMGNTFADSNAGGQDFSMTASGAGGRILLNLGGSAAADFNTAAGVGNYELTNTGGTFNVFDKTNTFNNLRNNGTVVPNPNAAAFGDSAVAPPLPTVPP